MTSIFSTNCKQKLFKQATLFAFAITSFSFSGYAQAPDWKWGKSIGGAQAELRGLSCFDNDGHIIVAGEFKSTTLTVGSTVLTNTAPGSSDIFVAKLDTTGNVIWATSAGSNDDDHVNAITADLQGNIYLTGDFAGSAISFDTSVINNNGLSDYFVAYLHPSGNFVWAKGLVVSGDHESGTAITTDAAMNIIVSGIFYGATIAAEPSTMLVNNGTVADIFMVKYNYQGDVIWSKSYGGTGFEKFNNMTTDASNNIFATGYSNSSSLPFGSTTLTNGGSNDLIVAKFDHSGNAQWAKSISDLQSSMGSSVAVNTSGDVFVAGHFNQYTLDFNGNTYNNATNNIAYDVVLLKYNSTGNPVTAKVFGGVYDDEYSSLAIDKNNDLYLTMDYRGNNILGFSSTFNSGTGSPDFLVAKLNSNLNELWYRTVPAPDNNVPHSISVDKDKRVVVSGIFNSSDLQFNNDSLYTAGAEDVFVALMDIKTTGPNAIDDVYASQSLTVFPNPASNFATVIIPENISHGHLNITDLSGRILDSKPVSSSAKLYINLKGMAQGTYLLHLKSDKNIFTEKLTVQ